MKEQKLIDLCFQLVLIITGKEHIEIFKLKSDEEKANWVRKQLIANGFNVSEPVGCSWGILKNEI